MKKKIPDPFFSRPEIPFTRMECFLANRTENYELLEKPEFFLCFYVFKTRMVILAAELG